MRKKVLIIGPSYLPIPSTEGGAIEGLIDEYLKYNSEKRKYDVTVYSTFSNSINIDNNLKYNNTTFRYINKNNILYYIFRIICLILKFFRKNKQNPYPYALNVIHDIRKRKENNTYDIIIIENQIESIITYRKFLKGKLISHLHNDYLNSDTIQAKKILDSCDEVWGVSNFICKQICTIDSETVKKVNTLYNGIDLRKFDTKDISSKEKNQMYKRIGVSSNNFIVLYVGRIMPEKGVLELAKAFNLAKEKNDNMKLIIVGAKKGRSNDLDEYYKKIEDEQQKSNNSIVFYGKADSKELRVLYSIANVQVVPSFTFNSFKFRWNSRNNWK